MYSMGNTNTTNTNKETTSISKIQTTNEQTAFKQLIGHCLAESSIPAIANNADNTLNTTDTSTSNLKSSETNKHINQPITNQIYFEQTLNEIIQHEILYYQTIVDQGGMNTQRSFFGARYSQFFSSNNNSWRRRSGAVSINKKAKQKFISDTLPKMIKEYELFMLNLATQYKNKDCKSLNKLLSSFKLPISVQLLWRCHLLHPAIYYKDCMTHFGFILSPQMRSIDYISDPEERQKKAVKANKTPYKFDSSKEYVNIITDCQPWNYGCNAGHFWQELTNVDPLYFASPSYVKWKKKWDTNINKDVKFTNLQFEVTLFKQLEFMTKANCGVWNRNFFNNIGNYVKKYAQYLQTGATLLMNKDINFEFDALSPTYNIDLVWHTHMMYLCLYCRNITNKADVINEQDLGEDKYYDM
eukprot:88194_1